ncbi:pyridoxal reductase [Diplogelasinospora grovesii]|uniref:Pyridoxal reductase n=1 Tax=Diplogelasinospora grovesii TaxID=303347 RepID=A0AAN6ND40_9PEZI|nr:pyridoxal reductase [Diplogelasinospora grovesii]
MVHTFQGKTVGNIGFGLMGFTLRGRVLSDEQIFTTMKAALESGCNYWNGGEFYGTPERNSLTVLERYYERYPEDVGKILLNVKGCIYPAENFRPDSSPEGVKTSIESCVRMIGGKGRIDQFEAARKDPKVDIEVTMKAMQGHINAGDIGGIALSEVSAKNIRRAAKVAKITAVEIELSLWETEPLTNGVVQACAELDIPILAYSPLGKGMLTGQVKSFDDLAEGDFRRMLPRFQPDVFEENLRLVREVETLAARKGCTPGQIAINWLLALAKRPGMPEIIPIPGATTVERVKENAVEIDLTEEDLAEIDELLKKFTPVGDRYPAFAMHLLDKE